LESGKFIYLFQFWLLQILKIKIIFKKKISHFGDKLPIFKKGLG